MCTRLGLGERAAHDFSEHSSGGWAALDSIQPRAQIKEMKGAGPPGDLHSLARARPPPPLARTQTT